MTKKLTLSFYTWWEKTLTSAGYYLFATCIAYVGYFLALQTSEFDEALLWLGKFFMITLAVQTLIILTAQAIGIFCSILIDIAINIFNYGAEVVHLNGLFSTFLKVLAVPLLCYSVMTTIGLFQDESGLENPVRP